MQALLTAMSAQTKAINELVNSNQQVIALLTEVVAQLADDAGSVLDDGEHEL